MTKMTEMTLPDLHIALAKIKERKDRIIMSEIDYPSILREVFTENVEATNICIKHLEAKITVAQRAKLNGEVYIILRDKELE